MCKKSEEVVSPEDGKNQHQKRAGESFIFNFFTDRRKLGSAQMGKGLREKKREKLRDKRVS